MSPEKISNAEERAELALQHGPFAINLRDIRRNLVELLSQFGRFGFFDSYTKHDISHIDEMLSMLDWIIPEHTKQIMSDADWLLTVLGIYFHDLGLLINSKEFEDRDNSGFPAFCERELFAGAAGKDYHQKVTQLSKEQADKFLYEEFVRKNHGRRVRLWIENKPEAELGHATNAIAEIDRLLKGLSPTARRDLGLICESHNLDDLEDTNKYKTSRPYGNSDAETANVNYCCLLLRTVDLLQITKQRAPSVLLRFLNPTDPVSQIEWVKQNAVTRVRAQSGKDKDGRPSPDAPKDTIEVFAEFFEENGYFGLTSYLTYAKKQISQSFLVSSKIQEKTATLHSFPWKYIDDTRVEAHNFLPKGFEFGLDHAKIPDLLTGHTIYNNSTVVVRELVQNSIDAVRLQSHIDKSDPSIFGEINIYWNPSARVLEIKDNGTGMSQEIIERHLLRVGSSRYQDAQFKERYQHFSPISRFGIGVLSVFMIADTIDITTCHLEQDDARQISLRSVHGKYLIRLLNKREDSQALELFPHGTKFRLKLRASANAENLLAAIQTWILLPGCNVNFVEIGSEPIKIGYKSPQAALESILDDWHSYSHLQRGDKIEVRQKVIDGVTIAYAVRWSSILREWMIHNVSGALQRASFARTDKPVLPPYMTCIEGIAVEFSTPGFRDGSMAAIVNATGKNAPKTNVARSALEQTEESENLNRVCYIFFRDLIQEEVSRIIKEENYSLTWASDVARYMVASMMMDHNVKAKNPELLSQTMDEVKIFLVEGLGEQQDRQAISAKELKSLEGIWTVECQAIYSAEALLKEFPSNGSLSNTIKVVSGNLVAFPSPLLCNVRSLQSFGNKIFNIFGLVNIKLYPAQRRADFFWTNDKPSIVIDLERMILRWASLGSRADHAFISNLQERSRMRSERIMTSIVISAATVSSDNSEDFVGVRAYGHDILFANQPIAQFLKKLASDPGLNWRKIAVFSSVFAAVVRSNTFRDANEFRAAVDRQIKQYDMHAAGISGDEVERYMEICATGSNGLFDPIAWGTRESPDGSY